MATQLKKLNILHDLLQHDSYFSRFNPVLFKLKEPLEYTNEYNERVSFRYLILRNRELIKKFNKPLDSFKLQINKTETHDFKISDTFVISEKSEILKVFNEDIQNMHFASRPSYSEVLTTNRDDIGSMTKLIFLCIHKGLPSHYIKKAFHDYDPEKMAFKEDLFIIFYNHILSDKATSGLKTPFSQELKEICIENLYKQVENFGIIYQSTFEQKILSDDNSPNNKFAGFEVNPESLEEHRQSYESNVFHILKHRLLNLSQEEISFHALKFFSIVMLKTLNEEDFPKDHTTMPFFSLLLPHHMKELEEKITDKVDPYGIIKDFLRDIQTPVDEDTQIETVFSISKKINAYTLHQETAPALSMQYIDKYNRIGDSLNIKNLSQYTNTSNNRFTEALTIYFKHAQEAICEELDLSWFDCQQENFRMFSAKPHSIITLSFNQKISNEAAHEFLNLVIGNINETTLTHALETKEMFKAVIKRAILDENLKDVSTIDASKELKDDISHVSFKI